MSLNMQPSSHQSPQRDSIYVKDYMKVSQAKSATQVATTTVKKNHPFSQ